MHTFFKKQDIAEFILHELSLVSRGSVPETEMFRTPLALAVHFTASGENGLMASFRAGEASASEGFETLYALRVAEYRGEECRDGKAVAAMDFLWNMWAGEFDEEINELITQEMKNCAATSFLWHRYLSESPKQMGVKYRALVESCAAGPILPATGGPIILGASELGDEEQEELKRTQEMLLKLRRNSISFETLPTIGGSSGADYSKIQLEKLWEGLPLGHKYQRKKRIVARSFSRRRCSPRTWPSKRRRRA